jgi:hypothetical protein
MQSNVDHLVENVTGAHVKLSDAECADMDRLGRAAG